MPACPADATLQSLLSFYRSLHEEFDYFMPADCIEGEVPSELRGTLLRNGPGQLEIFGTKLNQPFDGDGMICRRAPRTISFCPLPDADVACLACLMASTLQ